MSKTGHVRRSFYNEDAAARESLDRFLVEGVLNKGNAYIRRVRYTKDEPPLVILYSDMQMTDLKTACSKNGAILGIDTIWNLGPCYVTFMVYKNPNIVRNSQPNSPIMLGPAFLHWDSSYDTYCYFLMNIARELDLDPQNCDLVIGSNGNQEMVLAIERCFPAAILTLCTLHVRGKISRLLTSNGVKGREKSAIMSSIFGDEGLANVDSMREFDSTSQEIEDLHGQRIGQCWSEEILPTIRNKVVQARLRSNHAIPKGWKNNNCKSMNNSIKMSGNWKEWEVPELIERLDFIQKFQYIEIRRSLLGIGEYALAEHTRHLRLHHYVWNKMSPSHKTMKVEQFINYEMRKPELLTASQASAVEKKTGTQKRGGSRADEYGPGSAKQAKK